MDNQEKKKLGLLERTEMRLVKEMDFECVLRREATKSGNQKARWSSMHHREDQASQGTFALTCTR